MLWLLLAISCLGCEPAKRASKETSAAAPIVVEAPVFAAPPPIAGPPNPDLDLRPKPTGDTPGTGMVRDQASSGMTLKGKYEVDLITQPVSAYFTLKDQVVFNVQIPKMMQLFELEKGRKPASHNEFMDLIITRGAIKLPALPPESHYVYDPKLGELLVEHPRE